MVPERGKRLVRPVIHHIANFCDLKIITDRDTRPMVVRLVIYLIELYRRIISPLRPPTCRFSPSCSLYAQQSLREHGIRRGSLLAVKRLLRCHHFGSCGYDPVPLRVRYCCSDRSEAPAIGKM